MAKTKILIVDDDEGIRGMYAEVFSSAGFDVSEAIDGMDGLDKAVKDSPDVIFTGIMMSRMDGFGLMEALKKNAVTSNIPVVISSHRGREEDKIRAEELGARDFITIGYYTPREIVRRIKEMFLKKEYKLKIIPGELDAPKMAQDSGIKEGLKCQSCGEDLVIAIRPIGAEDHFFTARFICSQCQKQN